MSSLDVFICMTSSILILHSGKMIYFISYFLTNINEQTNGNKRQNINFTSLTEMPLFVSKLIILLLWYLEHVKSDDLSYHSASVLLPEYVVGFCCSQSENTDKLKSRAAVENFVFCSDDLGIRS